MDNKQIALTSGLRACARCGGIHDELLEWKLFQRPPDNYKFWAPCPTTGDPILLEVKDVV